MATPVKHRATSIGGFVKRVISGKTPRELLPLGKKISEQWAEVLAAEVTVDEAAQTALDAEEAARAAREGWQTGYRRLHAQLTDRFPNDKKRVERYFKSAALGKIKRAKTDDKAADQGEEKGAKKTAGKKDKKPGKAAAGEAGEAGEKPVT